MSLEDVEKRLHEERDHLQAVSAELAALLGKDGAGGPGIRTDPETVTKVEYFSIFRKYRTAEQDFLNHRVTWNLAIQGFLFATHGFCLQKLAELEAGENGARIDKARDSVAQLRAFVHVIPWIGLLLSLCIWLAVWGAWLVLKNLKHEWKKVPLEPYVPDPAGGGSKWARGLGFVPPLLIPPGFVIAWLYLILGH
jgi:hypothetical protein